MTTTRVERTSLSQFLSGFGAGQDGYAIVYDHGATPAWVPGTFEAAGAVAAHVGEADPHSQYALESALGTMATQAASAYAALASVNTFALAQTFTSGAITSKIYPPSDSTNAFGMYRANGTTQHFYYDSTNGTFGIGGAAAPSVGLTISATKNTGSVHGVQMQLFSNGATSEAYGVYARIRANAGSYTLSNAYGNYSEFTAQTGTTITNGRALYALIAGNGGGTITNAYGLQIAALGTVGTLYGIKIESLSSGSTNYAIHTSAGDIRLMASGSDKIGLHGATPIVRSTGWSATNVTPDKVFDANATTLDELADVVGTLITWLISRGDLAA